VSDVCTVQGGNCSFLVVMRMCWFGNYWQGHCLLFDGLQLIVTGSALICRDFQWVLVI